MEKIKIKSIKKIGIAKVKNLKVHKNHTFITENGIITHNCDGATDEFYKALRPEMERFSKNVRFIASCNYLQKIPEAIYKSRFLPIPFDPINNEEEVYLKAEYKNRVALILNSIGISYTDDILSQFINNDFPDLRSLMNKIQSLQLRGVAELSSSNISTISTFKDLFDLCLTSSKNPYENYKTITGQFGTKVDEALAALGSDLPEYIKNTCPAKLDKLPGVLIEIANYQYQKSFVIDPVVTLLACVFRIQQILN